MAGEKDSYDQGWEDGYKEKKYDWHYTDNSLESFSYSRGYKQGKQELRESYQGWGPLTPPTESDSLSNGSGINFEGSEEKAGNGGCFVIILLLLLYLLFDTNRGKLTIRSESTIVVTPIQTSAPTVLPTILDTAADSNDVQKTIEALIYRWYDIKTEADRKVNSANLNTVLRGDFLEHQLNVIKTLRDKNCYWIFSNRRIQFDSFGFTIAVMLQ